jgi:ankyrin repeat protein/type II secretory pathway predicted ATPase ExeA
MYLDFFKFNRKPFSITPDPDYFFLTASARQTYDRIADVIHRRKPCLLLSGEPGTGKTALLKRLMTKDDSGVRWIFLNKAQLTWNELLIVIGQDLGLSGDDYCSDRLAAGITEKFAEISRRGLHPVLVIDEADHFQNDTLRLLLEWHASNQAREISSTIIFAGLKKLAQTFADIGQGLFAAHPVDHCDLKRFVMQETRAVIAYRLELAGYSGPELFEDEALKLIQQLSGGIPRVINLICDLGLVLAASLKEQKISAQIVQEASEYILLDKYPGMEDSLSEEQPATNPELVESAAGDKGPSSEQLVIAAEAPNPGHSRPERRPFRWEWATAGLLIMLTGGGAWLWMQSRANVDSPNNSQRQVFKVPSNKSIENTKISVSPPESSPQPALPVSSLLAAVEPQSTPSGPAEVVHRAKQQPANPPQTIPPPAKNIAADAKTLMDIPEEKESSTLLSQPEETRSSLAQVPGEGSQAEAAAKIPTKQEISPVNPQLQQPAPTPKPYTAALEPEAARLTTSAHKSQEKPRAVDPPKKADLITAVETGDPQVVSQLLDDGAKINSINTTGETALMKAAWAGRADIVTLLLSHGPRINQQSLEGWTALFYGAVKGHKPVVASLLAQGAKPDLADQDGRTPLMAAAWNGHADIVELLLKKSGNPNRKNRDGWTPLMFAALEGHVDVAERLLRGGANPSVKNNAGDTSAQLAADQGHTRFLSLLSTQGGP